MQNKCQTRAQSLETNSDIAEFKTSKREQEHVYNFEKSYYKTLNQGIHITKWL